MKTPWDEAAIERCQSDEDVQAILGFPDETSIEELKLDSVWGLQQSMRHKIRGGEHCMQWVYHGDSNDLGIWFANVNKRWVITFFATLPHGILRRR